MFIDLLATAAIGGYQRFISPYKGFCCAYRFHTGRRSCSAYASAIVDRLGAKALRAAMPRQFERCSAAFAALNKSDSNRRENRRWWEHLDCDPCDVLSCADLPCDCSP